MRLFYSTDLRGNESGASLVELAILTPVFLLFIAGMVDIGFRLNSMKIVSNAVEHGARVGAAIARDRGNPPTALCGPDILLACPAAAENTIPTAGSEVTEIARRATCNYLRQSKLDATQWLTRVSLTSSGEMLPSAERQPGLGREFFLVQVSVERNRDCTFCYGRVVDNIVSGSIARFPLEGRCRR